AIALGIRARRRSRARQPLLDLEVLCAGSRAARSGLPDRVWRDCERALPDRHDLRGAASVRPILRLFPSPLRAPAAPRPRAASRTAWGRGLRARCCPRSAHVGEERRLVGALAPLPANA